MSNNWDQVLLQARIIEPLDTYLARLLAEIAADESPALQLAAALVSAGSRQGHVCLDLRQLASQPLPPPSMHDNAAIVCPSLDAWLEALRRSPVVGEPGSYHPLILDDHGRLYLYRYWAYEDRLARDLRRRAAAELSVDPNSLRPALKRLFPGDDAQVNWARVAAAVACKRQLMVLSGGPGTGKTTAVVRILALIIEHHLPRPPAISLAAPTGKAAARLQQVVAALKERLPCDQAVMAAIPTEASTIHRLLSSRPPRFFPASRETEHLAADLVVIDEASMADLPLMSRLVQALPPGARLLLVGDRDQLASVQPGAVLGDICSPETLGLFSPAMRQFLTAATGHDLPAPAAPATSPLADCIVHFRQRHRFAGDSPISALSDLVNSGDADAALDLLHDPATPEVAWRDLPSPASLPPALESQVLPEFRRYFQAADPEAMLGHLDRFRLLCALRHGPFGSDAVNSTLEKFLRHHRLISDRHPWYPGRPVMIVNNDYRLRLYNGDVGVVWHVREDPRHLQVYIAAADGLRRIHPLMLPEHETVYATTVHKSQGSEFDQVIVILPDRDSPVLCRELLYTAITRAKIRLEIWGTAEVFAAAVTRRTTRHSGLRTLLWSKA